MGKSKALIASCIWIAGLVTPSWAASISESPPGATFVENFSSHPYPFSLSEDTIGSPFVDYKGLRLSPLRAPYSPAGNEKERALWGVKAHYEMGLGRYRMEFSGGYAPAVNSFFPSEAPVDSESHLGYIDLRIPLSQFHVKGGAFFGQNMEALDMLFKGASDERNSERALLGYQIGGGYRFSDLLTLQAGLGQATQEYETTKEYLRAFYLQARISLGWRMSITPQVGYIDFTKEDGEKITEEAFYCGARWQISF